MSIDIPEATLDHLENAPLKVAVAQIRYSPVHAVEKRDLVADYESKLDDRYVAQDAQVSQTLTLQVGGGPVAPASPPSGAIDVVWPFRDDERGYSVSLSNSSLAVEADSTYHDFPQFLSEFQTAVDACATVFAPKRQLRLGLRYVNEIADGQLRDDGVHDSVNPELVTPVGTTIQGGLLRSFTELRVQESLGTFVIRHGLIDAAVYLLDFDYFSEEERSFDPDEIVGTVKGFHELIERFFVWAISDEYLARLKERNSDGR